MMNANTSIGPVDTEGHSPQDSLRTVRFTDTLLEELLFELLRAEKGLGVDPYLETISVFAPSLLEFDNNEVDIDLYVERDERIELVIIKADAANTLGMSQQIQGYLETAVRLHESTKKKVKVVLACIWCSAETRAGFSRTFPSLQILDASQIAGRIERVGVEIPRNWTQRDGLLEVTEQLRLTQKGFVPEITSKREAFYERHFGSTPTSIQTQTWMRQIETGRAFEAAILNADIVSFSLLLHAVDQPDRLQSILGDYCQTVRQVVFKYGGAFDKFMGDGFLAYWGVSPYDTEREAEEKMQHAVAAASRLVQVSANVLADITDLADRAVDTGVRVGIGYGSVFLFNKPTVLDELLAYGDALNVSFRVQGAAAPNGVSLTRRAWNALQRPSEFEAREHEAKHGEKYFAYCTPDEDSEETLKKLLYRYERAIGMA